METKKRLIEARVKKTLDSTVGMSLTADSHHYVLIYRKSQIEVSSWITQTKKKKKRLTWEYSRSKMRCNEWERRGVAS